MGERPLAALDFVFLWTGQFEQVADGGGKNTVIALEVVVVLGETAQRARNVGGD